MSRHLVTPCPDGVVSRRTVTTPNAIDALRRATLEWSFVVTSKFSPGVEITHGGSSAMPVHQRQRIKRHHGGGNAVVGRRARGRKHHARLHDDRSYYVSALLQDYGNAHAPPQFQT